jgi:hypothetical protein
MTTASKRTYHLCGLGRAVFTTGTIGRLCRVATRTVTKWADKGLLKCHRIPGSRDRRVDRADLIAFLVRYEFTEALGRVRAACSVLLWGAGDGLAAALAAELGTAELLRADCPADAGSLWERLHPPAALVDTGGGTEAGLTLARWLAARVPRPVVLLVYPEDRPADPVPGCRVLRHPCGAAEVVRVLRQEGVSGENFPTDATLPRMRTNVQ